MTPELLMVKLQKKIRILISINALLVHRVVLHTSYSIVFKEHNIRSTRGGSKNFQRDAPTPYERALAYYSAKFSQNCMKMKKIGSRGRSRFQNCTVFPPLQTTLNFYNRIVCTGNEKEQTHTLKNCIIVIVSLTYRFVRERY